MFAFFVIPSCYRTGVLVDYFDNFPSNCIDSISVKVILREDLRFDLRIPPRNVKVRLRYSDSDNKLFAAGDSLKA